MEILPRSFAHLWMICTKILQLGLAPKFGKILPGQFFKRFCIATWCKNRRPCSVVFCRASSVETISIPAAPRCAKPSLYCRRPRMCETISIPAAPTTASNQPTNQPTKQPSNQATKQPSNQATNQPSNQAAKQPSNHPATQSPSHPVTQPPCPQAINQPTNPTQPNQPTSQSTKQPTNQPFFPYYSLFFLNKSFYFYSSFLLLLFLFLLLLLLLLLLLFFDKIGFWSLVCKAALTGHGVQRQSGQRATYEAKGRPATSTNPAFGFRNHSFRVQKPQLPTDVGVESELQGRVDEQVVFGLCDEGRPALQEARSESFEATFKGTGLRGGGGGGGGSGVRGCWGLLHFSRAFFGWGLCLGRESRQRTNLRRRLGHVEPAHPAGQDELWDAPPVPLPPILRPLLLVALQAQGPTSQLASST